MGTGKGYGKTILFGELTFLENVLLKIKSLFFRRKLNIY